MPFAAALSTARSLENASDAACADIQSQLNGAIPDLTLVFVSPHHVESCESLAETISQRLGTRVLLGCSGETVAHNSRELEEGPALVLWSAVLPGARLDPFHVTFQQTPDGFASQGFPEPPEETSKVRGILFLGEPYSTPPDSVIDRVEEDFPGVPLIGGMASSTRHPGTNRLFLGTSCVRRGGVGVVITGGPQLRSVVSQGCRPIGQPFVVTKSDENVILALGGKSPLHQFGEIYRELSPADQRLAQNGLQVGLALDEYRESFGRGDFLISNVIGADSDKGAIAIGHAVRPGQTVQFHVRDADTAHEDLTTLLSADIAKHASVPEAALLFSCNGRGTNLFPAPDHDARTIRELAGAIPLAGFFAQGEFGPIGRRNHVHGYTASIVLWGDGEAGPKN